MARKRAESVLTETSTKKASKKRSKKEPKRVVKSDKKSKVRTTIKKEEKEQSFDSVGIEATIDGMYQLSRTVNGNQILKPIAANGTIDLLKKRNFKSLEDFKRDFMDQINNLRGDLDFKYVNRPTPKYMKVVCNKCSSF